MSSILIETPDYSPWFSARKWNFDFGKKRIPGKSTSKGEQNGANFTFIAPSSEEQ